MALNIQTGRKERPPKIVIYSAPKGGKSTWASQAPAPVFIQCEEGLDALDVAHFPLAASYREVLQALRDLYKEDHDYKTVVIDSLDWLEPLIWDSVCEKAQVKSIEQVGGGWGKGYIEASILWRQILDGLDCLRNKKGMMSILICHAEIRTAAPPDGEPHEYSGLKLNRRAAGLVSEWADIIGYAREQKIIKKEGQGFSQHARPLSSGERVLVVGSDPAYITGNRFSLPKELPLQYAALDAALKKFYKNGNEKGEE